MADIPKISTKRLAISKANAQMVAIVGVGAFITVFCLVASHAVLAQNRYQSRVTKARETAHTQLVSDINAFNSLVSSYQSFENTPQNVLGGSTTGSGPNDGDNAKIVLDALPSVYDFPALTSSLEQILTNSGLKIGSITGTDDQVNQQANTSSPDPKAVPIPFSFTVSNATYAGTQSLINTLQNSIRPIQIDTLSLTGGANDMSLTVSAHTFYQPGKTLSITQEVVK